MLKDCTINRFPTNLLSYFLSTIFHWEMLILVSPTNWANPVSLILSASSSNSSISHNVTPHQQICGSFMDASPTLANRRKVASHQRGIDNPFNVLYDPNSARHTENRKTSELQSLSYLHIEKELQAGRSPAKSTMSSQKPIVTVIDETNLRRAGSVLSRSLSTLHHGTIRRRNRMAKRSELKSQSPSIYSVESEKIKSRPKSSRWSSLFPIKTRRSFKYTPVSKALRKPHFESQKETDDFYLLDGIAAVVREMLPRTMLTFKFKKITKILPELHLHPERFTITRNNSFRIIDSKATNALFQATKVAQPIDKEAIRRFPESRKASIISARRQVFLSTVYNEYREKVLSGKFLNPPKFELVLPFEAGIMKPEEKASMDVKILLDVLLRRTLAAKIEFRLGQSGILDSTSRSSVFTSDQSLMSRYSGNGGFSLNYSAKKDSSSTAGDSDHNADKESVTSHNPLPSPQISSVSQFEEAYSFLQGMGKPRELLTSEISSILQESGRSLLTQTPKTLINRGAGIKQTPSPKSFFTSSSLYSATPPNSGRQLNRQNSTFNNFLFAPPSPDVGSLSNMNMYSLQPMNRSVTTISSALESNFDSEPRSDESRTLPLRIPSMKKVRGDSNSTTGTSVLHSLDDLSKRTTQYIGEKTPENVYVSQTPSLLQIDTPPVDPSESY